MMNKKIVLMLAIILITPFTVAASTQINVETLQGVTVTVSILETADTYYAVQSFYDLPAGDTGNVSVTYNGDKEEFDLAVYVKIGGETAYYERFRGFTAGEPIYVQLPKKHDAEAPAIYKEQNISSDVNESNNTASTTLESTNSTAPGLTGFATSENGRLGSYKYYLIGAVLLVGLLVASFAVRAKIRGTPKAPSNPESIAQKSLPRLSPAINQPAPKEDMRAKIEDAERKIREASADLERIKKKEKIEETEQRLEQERKDLERMRSEFDGTSKLK